MRKCFVLMALLSVMTTGCGSPKLAAQVDDLLRAGKVAEANAKLSKELPDLARQGKLSEVEDVAQVVERRTAALPRPQAAEVKQTGLRSAVKGVNEELSNYPLDDICEYLVSNRVPSSVQTSGRSKDFLTQMQNQSDADRKSLAIWCEALGLI